MSPILGAVLLLLLQAVSLVAIFALLYLRTERQLRKRLQHESRELRRILATLLEDAGHEPDVLLRWGA